MALFRRPKPDSDARSTGEAIAAFWHWWTATGAAAAARAIANNGDFGDLPDEISRHLDAINPDLEWELAAGRSSEHALCVTSGGVAELRPLAERWRRAAPPPTAVWEYVAARRADPAVLSTKLGLGTHQLDLSEAEFSLTVDDERQLVDVVCHHPMFREMPESMRGRVTFLLLDWLLGEDDVERWIGAVEHDDRRPGDSVPAEALPEVVRSLAERHAEPGWALLRGRADDGSPILVTAMRPLRWIDHPLLDLHIVVRRQYENRQTDGLPLQDGLEALRDFEDDLMAVVGSRALMVAHETNAGSRWFHLYADSADPLIEPAARAWAERQPDVTVQVSADPAWRAVRRYR